MPDFSYIARDNKGDKITGTLSAQSERDVINILSGRSLFPVQVEKDDKPKQFRIGSGVNDQTMSTFYSQMAGLLRSGVPLLRSIRILRDQSSNQSLKDVLEQLETRIEDGESLGDAMGRYPKVFNEVGTNMAKAGAEGGFLEDALDRVGKFTEQQADLKARTVGALIYPVLLMTVGFVLVSVLLVFFVPKFGQMFAQLREKGQLPAVTDYLLNFSEFLQRYGLIFLLIGAILYIVFWVQSRTKKGRRFKDAIKLKIPLFGDIFRSLAVARFCRVLGTLLKNGVPILRSLEISSAAAGNEVLSGAVEDASENITAGESLASPLEKSGHFPQTVVEMIAVAEESNSLDTVLVDIADGLEIRTARRLDLAVRMLEPMMLLLMAGIVLFIVIALLLPVIRMSSAIG